MYVSRRDQGPAPAEDDENKTTIKTIIPTIPTDSTIEPTVWMSTPEPSAGTAGRPWAVTVTGGTNTRIGVDGGVTRTKRGWRVAGAEPRGDAKPFPFSAAFLAELAHRFTSAWTRLSTASTESRAARHSDTPAASARRPSREGQ